jgi:hypothetical protein
MLFVLCSSFVVVVESSKCIDTDGEYMNGSSVIYIGLEAEARKNVDVGVCVVLFLAKEYAMRDSNPQPPDSKSDTLSIAPTAPPKRLLTQQPSNTQTTNKPTRNKQYNTHTNHTHTHI